MNFREQFAGQSSLLRRCRDGLREFGKYFAASGVALAVDFCLLVGLTEVFGLHYLWSAAIGFSVGCACLYLISVSFVFADRRVENRRAEFLIFAIIGGAGLVLTQAMMFALVSLLAVAYPLAKVATVFVTFFFNFGMRKAILFRSPMSLGA